MIWHVPHTHQVVRVMEIRDPRPVLGWNDPRRYRLVLDGKVLIRASPFPFTRESVRFADVTGDGRADVLVTVLCSLCNHSVAAVSVYTNAGRRIYGHGFIGVAKGGHSDAGVHGRVLTETAWGARRGDIWFDAPLGSLLGVRRSQTFLHWTKGQGWRRVVERRVLGARDRLVRTGYPPP